MIRFENVTKTYNNGVSSLFDVTFGIEEGEFVFMIGPSGAGKTTALRMIIREELPTDGTIVISDYDVTRMPRRFLPSLRRQIGVIFQDFKLLPGLTVAENIAFILQISGKPDSEIDETVSYLLNVVNLTDRAHLYPRQLSGGEQQRVTIARAIANDPAIVLADEPTGNLDPENAAQVMELLRQINSWGTTVLVSTHDPTFVDSQKSRVLALEGGKLVKDYVGEYLDSLADKNKITKAKKSKKKLHKKKPDHTHGVSINVKSEEDFDEEAWEDLVEKNTESLIFDEDDREDHKKTKTKSKSKKKSKKKKKK